MGKPKLVSHSDCRPKVCLFCFRKVPSRDLRNYPSYLQTIKENLIEHYDVHDVRLPCGLCETHKRSLNYLKKSLTEEGVRNCQFDFARLSSYLKCGVKLRRKAQDCECLICRVARATGFNADHVLKKFLEEESENIGDTSAGSSNKPDRLCGKCLHPLRKGCKGHICNQTNLLKNIANLLPEKVKERVASDVLKRKLEDSDNQEVTFHTGGKPLKVGVHKAGDITEPQISHEQINRMKKRLNLSRNQTLTLAEELRAVHASRKLIPSNLKSFLKDKNSEFEDIFEFEQVNGEEVIFCSDVAEHSRRVSNKRGHNSPKLVKIGLDGGQGTLKCAATYLFESDSIFETSEPASKRRKFSEGLNVEKLSNNNGVNRVQILSLSTDSEENYEKLKFMLGKLNLEPGSFLLCADLKVINISLGLQTHSARHPCPYCHWTKGKLSTDDVLRTFEGIKAQYDSWMQGTGGDRAKLKNFFNCQDVPLSIFPLAGMVLDHVPLSELHIMMGVTNKLVDELIKVKYSST